MRKIRIILLVILLACLFTQGAYSEESQRLYHEGLNLARRGDMDFAFMRYQLLLENYPDAEFIEHVLFAVGERYFSMSDYYNAAMTFNEFINRYPESDALPFALIYLAKISRQAGKEDLATNFEKAVISFKQTSLLFTNYKEHTYVSSFYKKYKAVYFIDRVEIYINNELSAKIPL
jgi:outer membrane protein assembly factor BamD (BamD/ComL family)